MSKLGILKEVWEYLRVKRKWWLVPIVIFLLLFGLAFVFVSSSSFAPLIYPLF